MNNKINKKVDFILCLLLGYLGIHKFYEKKILIGILYLCTGGLFFIGWIYDCIKLGSNLNKNSNIKNENVTNYQENNNISSITHSTNTTDETTNNSLTIKVTGVTYNNPDGTSRQEYIENLPEDEILELQSYDYKGNNAIYVLDSERHILGNIPKNKVEQIQELIDVNGFYDITIAEKDVFTNEKNEEVYYLTICINLI